MNFCFNSTFYLLFALLSGYIASQTASGAPRTVVVDRHELPAPALRAKRKVSQLDSSGGALEYMAKLRERFTDSDGRPKFDREDDPTSVWCIRDRDIIRNVYRPRPTPPAQCTVQNKFVFNWESLADSELEERLPLQKSFIRAYLKPIPRLLKQVTAVELTVTVGLTGETEFHQAGQLTVQVTNSTSWIELDVTTGMQQLWPPSSDNNELVFTIDIRRVDCTSSKRVPAIFIDPTEIPVSKAKRRQRHEPFQPLLLVEFSDIEIKDMVRNETLSFNHQPADDQVLSKNHTEHRVRRATSCKTEPYPVVFNELKLYYVLIPFMYNARQCSGSCSHFTLTEQSQLGTNHANIMAGAYALFKAGQPITVPHPPQEPCCVPTKYSPMTLVVKVGDSIEYVVYPAMRVEECGCR